MGIIDLLRDVLTNGGLNIPVQRAANVTSVGEEVAPRAAGVRPWTKTARRARISPLPVNRVRWIQADVETALHRASTGDLQTCSQLHRAFQRDGALQGVMGTRTGGLIRLPKRFLGTTRAVVALGGSEGRPGLFDEYFPQPELQQLDADGLSIGVGVGQFVLADGDKHAQLVRLDPEYLRYRWYEDRWYYQSTEGLLPITPGDGRWVLHTPYGRYDPWNRGLWQALSRAFISKEHAILNRENYGGKLANPARVAVSPQGASEMQKQGWFKSVMAWGINSVFGVTPGYDVKLLESNGRGFEVFGSMIETSDREYSVMIAGQVVTVDGGAGFQNSNIHATIRSDLIQGDGNALAGTLNTQAIPAVVQDVCGPDDFAHVAWDTRPAADMTAGAASIAAAAQAIQQITAALAPLGFKPDIPAILARFAIPILGDQDGAAIPEVGRPTPDAPAPTPAPTPAPAETSALSEAA